MILSRGLRWPCQSLGISRKRAEPLCRRSLSSFPAPNFAIRSSSPLTKPGAISCKTPIRPRIRQTHFILHNGAFQRHQSTASTLSDKASSTASSTSTAAATTADNTFTNSAFTDINGAIDLSSLDLQEVPIQIGYLKSLGLDFGYGPTSVIEWILEHIHVLAGTPWWASIVLTALALRVSLLYIMHGSADNAARMAAIKHIRDPLDAKMKAASARKDSAEMWRARAEITQLQNRAGVKMTRAFLPLIQVPLGFGTFILLRAMAKLPVPGFETGGVLWFPNLAIPDPIFLLPAASAGILHWVLRTGGETGVNNMSPSVLKFVSYFLPALTIVFTSWLPAGLQLSFLVSSIFSCLQQALFRWPTFRTLTNMVPLAPKSDITPPPSPMSVLSRNAPTSIVRNDAPQPTALSKLTKPLKAAVEDVQASIKGSVKSAKQFAGEERGPDGRRSKSEIREAERYEKKRQAEEKRKLDERYEKRKRMERSKRSGKLY